MYAKIPFNSGWSSSDLLSVLQYLVGGGTSVASLPAGVKTTAEIVNTVPAGWTVTTSNTSVLICNAPINGLSSKRKHVRIDTASSSQLNMTVGESSNTTDVRIDGVNVTKQSRLWGDGSTIPTTYNILLHVFITPQRFMTCIERLTTTDPIVRANLVSCISGVSDADFNDIHYSDSGTLLPFAVFDRMESSTTSDVIVSIPRVFANPRPTLTYSTYPKGVFVMGGYSSDLCRPPANGAVWAGSTVDYQQLYELGVGTGSLDPVTGKCIDMFTSSPNFAPFYGEHVVNSKTYVALPVSSGVTTLLIPKE